MNNEFETVSIYRIYSNLGKFSHLFFKRKIFLHTILLLFSGCKDVYNNCQYIWNMLDPVPLVLRICLSQQPDDYQQLCAASLPRLLLASNVKCYGQSYNILLDE